MHEDIVRSDADESARQAHDVVRPVTYARRNSINSSPKRVPSMRKILPALMFLTCRAVYADNASHSPRMSPLIKATPRSTAANAVQR